MKSFKILKMIDKKNIHLILIAFFCLYVVTRVMLNISVTFNPDTIEDTTAYLRISRKSLLDQNFWTEARPFVFPLFLKAVSQNLSLAALFQLVFSIFSWGCLAFIFIGFLKNYWMKVISFNVLLLLSLSRYFSSWDYMIMTESLSISLFVLFLAFGMWLLDGWSKPKVVIFIITGILFAFVRDTNAYVLLFLSGLLLLAMLFRWISFQSLIFILTFVGVFFLNNWTSNLGSRWVFPFNNNVGRRILPSSQGLKFFESCGMPVTPELLALTNEFANGQNRAFYNDPALDAYRIWLQEDGKSCYIKYLMSDLLGNTLNVIGRFDELVKYQKINAMFAPGYDPLIPYFLEGIIYPVNLGFLLWFITTGVALFFLWRRQWSKDPIWGVYILLCLLILPHLFVTWFGDAMAPDRHTLSVGLQFVLSIWFLILLSADRLITRISKERSNVMMVR